MNMVVGDVIGQQGHATIEQRLSQADTIALPVECELQEELPVMATVGEVIGKARNDVPISPWHAGTMHEPVRSS